MPTTKPRPRKTAPPIPPPDREAGDLCNALAIAGLAYAVPSVAQWNPDERAEVREWLVAIAKPGNVRLPDVLAGKLPQGWKRPAADAAERSPLRMAPAATVTAGEIPLSFAGSGLHTSKLCVPPSKLRASATNARKEFDAEQLALLGASMKRGQIQPIVVLPAGPDGTHTIVAGERRWRAAKSVRLPEVWIAIRDITEEEALEDQVEENLLRVDLNPIEEARALQSLIDGANLTQAALAKRYHWEQGTVSNKLRLLKLPEAWQALIIAREINPTTDARQLLQWVKRPAVLERALALYGQYPMREVGFLLRKAVEELSRPLSGWCELSDDKWGDVALSKKDREREDLDVEICGVQKRAFNVALWEELQKAGEARRAKGPGTSGKGPGPEGKESAADRKRKDEQAKAAWGRRLYKYRAAWLQRIVARVLRGEIEDAPLWKLALHCATVPACPESLAGGEQTDPREQFALSCAEWIESANLEGWTPRMSAEQLEATAVDLGIDFAADWSLDRAFLELHSRAQLEELAAEWKLKVAPLAKRGEYLDALWNAATARGVKCPKELAASKPCLGR